MTQTFRDRFQLNLVFMVLFITGIAASLYQIYSLPHELRLSAGYQPVFFPVYATLAVTFVLGMIAIAGAFRDRREVIVFRDKIIDTAKAGREAADQEGRTTISLDTVRTALEEAQPREAVSSALQSICRQLEAGQGALYIARQGDEKRVAELLSGYALSMGESTVLAFEFGEGLVGQVAATGQTLFVDDVPAGYITVLSGLGKSSPRFLLVAPVKSGEKVAGVLELATFVRVTEDQRRFVEESAQLMVEKLEKLM